MMEEKIYQIGVLIGNVHTQHPMELIKGICEAAKGERVNTTFFVGAQGNALDFWEENFDENNMSAYSYQYNSLYDYALIAGLDALIISYGTLCIFLEKEDREAFTGKFRGIPLVVLEDYDEASQDSFLISDNYGSMYTIVEHLLSVHGYKKILYLSGPRNNRDSQERESAYRSAMAAYGLEVDDSMIEYGDYSSEVDGVVEKLLDSNPDAEAIVSANDEMTLSIYRVCRRRGLTPGRDLAVTGYDDVDFAQRMDPPLTTADQDGLDMGYRALKCAISVCRDQKSIKLKLPARFVCRQSCGCRDMHTDEVGSLSDILDRVWKDRDPESIKEAAIHAAKGSFQSIATQEELDCGREYFSYLIDTLLSLTDPEGDMDEKEIISADLWELQKLCQKVGMGAVNFTGFNRCFHQILFYFMQNTRDHGKMLLFEQIQETADSHITSFVMRSSEDRINMILNKNWTTPASILYMIEKAEDESAFNRLALENTVSQGAKSAYLYLLPEPVRYDRESMFTCPDELELAAEYVDGSMRVYDPGSRPIVTKKDGFSLRYPFAPEHSYVAFILFARAYQYGIMLCEIEADSIGLMYGIALQISTAKSYMQISRLERETKKKLYATLKELEEKNRVLSFVSETDELTGLFNRRGFVERALAEVNSNIGKPAAILFSDLDHLKQINDIFGHGDGDFALKNAARILKESMSRSGGRGIVCGRIGGDEFVSLMIYEYEDEVDEVLRQVREKCRSFNEESDKPYYVEFSTGCVRFTCAEDISVTKLTEEADALLYEAKKSRRESVLKGE